MFSLIIGFIVSLFEKEGVSAVKGVVVGVATGGASFFVKALPWILSALVLFGLLGVGWYYDHEYNAMKTQITALTDNNKKLSDSNKAEGLLLDKCTTNTQALQKASAALAASNADLNAAAQAKAKTYYHRSKSVSQYKAQPNQSDYDASNQFLNTQIPAASASEPLPASN